MEYRDTANLEQAYIAVLGKQRAAQPLTSEDYEVVDHWQAVLADMSPDDESIEDEIQLKSGSYAGVLKSNATYAVEEQTSICYTKDVWDMLLLMFLGIMLLRMGFFEEQFSRIVHLSIAVFGIGIGLAVHIGLNIGVYANYSDSVASLYYLIFYDLGRLSFVVGCASLGLSNCLMQSIIGAFVFYGFGLAHFGEMSRLDLAAFILLVWIFQMIFSVLWMRVFNHGPVEWLWRSLTYWETQPLRIPSGEKA
jgi:uncharacterized protein